MNEFIFEQSPWEALISSQKTKGTLSALTLLSALEGEEDETVEDVFQLIEENHIVLDITTLPKSGAVGQAAVRLKQEEEMVSAGMHTEQLDENDPLRLYLEEISGIPAFGDENVLSARTASGDEDAMLPLANLGLSRVIQLAQSYVGYNVLLLDLIQEGSIGLWQAIQSYRGGEYAVHRDTMIRNALARAVIIQARSNGIGQKMRQALQDYRSTDEKLLMELGRNPTLEEIAEELHMTVEEAENVRKMLEDAMKLQRSEREIAPEEEESAEDDLAVEDTAYFQMRQRISVLLSQLTEQDAKLLTMRFGLEKRLPMSVEETARALGMTIGEVTAREAAALAKLRG